jgi:FtsP/CotA-like multicopper oxidase with cupredoxin domain
MVGRAGLATPVWAYDGAIPGPTLRFRRGDVLDLALENSLARPTTIHWHGLRVPNAMDGVGHLTQPPVEPGASFRYSFPIRDHGTFWYHPHVHSAEQVARGLAGALIVEDDRPPEVDEDVVWVLGDWRLDARARLTEDFGHFRDQSHDGRLGNTVTINGRVPESLAARPNARWRLRLLNAAVARVFALRFGALAPWIVARDGRACMPHPPPDGRVTLGPGERADLILDLAGDAGARLAVVDERQPRQAYRLVDLALDGAPVRATALTAAPAALPADDVAVPELARAVPLRLVLGGGMMDPRLARGEVARDMVAAAFRRREIWMLNGRSTVTASQDHRQHAGHHHDHGAPLFTLDLGRSYTLEIVNDTAWPHPVHLHGHVFRVETGAARGQWRDTLLVEPAERATVSFVADAPGDWMLHCHILDHQEAGMAGFVRVG